MSRHQAIFRLMFCAVLSLAAIEACGDAPKSETAAGTTVRGTLVARKGGILDVRDETETKPQHYILIPPGGRADDKTMAFVNGLAIGSEVQLIWVPDFGGKRISSLTVLAAPGKFGLVAGIVTDKSPDVRNEKARSLQWIEIQDDQGKKQRYSPRWVVTRDPFYEGMDREMLKAIADRNIGDRVEIRWAEDDHVRVTNLRLLALSPQAVAQPGGEGGSLIGRVTEKGKDWVSIKPDTGNADRYLPQRVIGTKDELDRDVLRAIHAARIGDRVEIAWFRDGDRRIYSWKPAGKLPATRPAVAHSPATRP